MSHRDLRLLTGLLPLVPRENRRHIDLPHPPRIPWYLRPSPLDSLSDLLSWAIVLALFTVCVVVVAQ